MSTSGGGPTLKPGGVSRASGTGGRLSVADPEFLESRADVRPWSLPDGAPAGLRPVGLYLGEGRLPLEVVVATAARVPSATQLRELWQARHGNTPSPLLLVVLHSGTGGPSASVCGPVPPSPAPVVGLPRDQVERIAATALAEPNRHAAVRFLQEVLPEADSQLPGVRNIGLVASHELQVGVPARRDWHEACDRGVPLLSLRGRPLVEALGFSVEERGTSTYVLRAGDVAAAVAVFLEADETAEAENVAYGFISPISAALARADMEQLPYVLITRGPEVRVYAARAEAGVGRRGRAETYVAANLGLLPLRQAGYLPLIFGAGALRPGGSLEQILASSRDFAVDLGTRLRERVYRIVVPTLAQSVARHRLAAVPELAEAELSALYEQALTILFRLLFIAYAEDKDLLPYRSDGAYQPNSLKSLSREFSELANTGRLEFDNQSVLLWSRFRELSRAVDAGRPSWRVPAYNGGLFSSDAAVNAAGAGIAELELTDAEFGPALAALLVDVGSDVVSGPVDFRSLSVREFGTIYEGLLESNLSIASSDLAVDDAGAYIPARGAAQVEVSAGSIYLHNASGARKSTGTYFTKPFAVAHLLDHALEPVLAAHIERLEALVAAGDEIAAADAFFDFRCADVAMGSGHFLVAAVDRIETRLSSFLASHRLPGVTGELARLRERAREALGPDQAAVTQIEDTSLLRRQIARRCIYGVDLNPISVELARLALWVHTFVPGLPLSFLSHNLVVGNSLSGISTIDEALAILDPSAVSGQMSLFREPLVRWLDRATESLRRLARTTDGSAAEIAEARQAQADAAAAVAPARHVFDLLIAARLGEIEPVDNLDEATIDGHPGLAQARSLAGQLKALHFPVAFPEVFVRPNPGFDCILGNPPWQEVMVDETSFWSTRQPAFRGGSPAEQRRQIAVFREARPDLVAEYEAEVAETDLLRRVLTAGPYPGMNEGNADLYKAFCWRFWALVRSSGRIGVVLPRAALSGAGSEGWRTAIYDGGQFEDVTTLLNTRQWVFDDVDGRYTFTFVAVSKGPGGNVVRLRGPFASPEAYADGMRRPPLEFPASSFRTWATGGSFPLLPTADAGRIFQRMREHPRLDAPEHPWRARPVQGDFNATTDRDQFIFDPPDRAGLWPVLSGAGFNLWTPDTGDVFAWAEPGAITRTLQAKRLNQQRRASSAFAEFSRAWAADPATLPCRHPRLVIRDVTNRTNQRTVIASLLPPKVVVTNAAPYFLWSRGDERDQAYLLGVLSSIPLDWYARCVVELHVNFHVLNGFPVPAPTRDDRRRRRVEEISGQLTAVDQRFAGWAGAVGVPVGRLGGEAREDLIAELDAVVASLYGLDAADLRHIFETFHPTWDYEGRLRRVLDYFDQWATA